MSAKPDPPADQMEFTGRPTILDLKTAKSGVAFNKAKKWSAHNLRHLCKLHGIVAGNIQDQGLLLAMLKKSPKQPVVYEGFSLAELVKFVEARGLFLNEEEQLVLESAKKALENLGSPPTPLLTSQNAVIKVDPKAPLEPGTAAVTDPTTNLVEDIQLPLRRSVRIKLRKEGKSYAALEESEPVDPETGLTAILEKADRERRFDFLGLPRELRNMVYDLVCQGSLTIVHPQAQPAITLACRQTREEALPIYYSSNRFAVMVDHVPEFPKVTVKHNLWLWRILPQHLTWIRSFAFVLPLPSLVVDVDFTFGTKGGFDIQVRDFERLVSQYPHWILGWDYPQGPLYVMGDITWHNILLRYRHQITAFARIGHDLVLGQAVKFSFGYKGLHARFEELIRNRVRLMISSATDSDVLSSVLPFVPREGQGLSIEHWKLLEEEWDAAAGFSSTSIRAMIVAVDEQNLITTYRSFWTQDS